MIGFASGEIPKVAANMILVKNFSVTGVVFGEHSWRYPADTRKRLGTLLEAWSQKQLKPRVMRTCDLDQAIDALRDLAARRAIGKIVLTR